jgi:hypothetical protein
MVMEVVKVCDCGCCICIIGWTWCLHEGYESCPLTCVLCLLYRYYYRFESFYNCKLPVMELLLP